MKTRRKWRRKGLPWEAIGSKNPLVPKTYNENIGELEIPFIYGEDSASARYKNTDNKHAQNYRVGHGDDNL